VTKLSLGMLKKNYIATERVTCNSSYNSAGSWSSSGTRKYFRSCQ